MQSQPLGLSDSGSNVQTVRRVDKGQELFNCSCSYIDFAS